MESNITVGERIRFYRKKQSMTIRELAEGAGLSKGLISQIENKLVSPPISTLFKIANVLDIPMAQFFQDDQTSFSKIVVIKKDERKQTERRRMSGTSVGYSYELLAWKKARKAMEPFIVTFEPKETEQINYFSHQGEEFHFVLDGRLEFIGDDTKATLEKGDSLYFEANISHGFRALDGKPARTLAVVHSDY